MSKWTPGPWQLTPCGDILGDRNTPQDNGLICAMCSDRRDDEGAANARLITEAPAMAELLEQFCAPGAAEDGRLSLGEILTRAQALLTTAPSLLSRVKGETT